jgi:hypothetical protein
LNFLINFHLTTEAITLHGSPPVLPKLQRLRLEPSTYLLNIISFETWRLPSIQYLDATLPDLGTYGGEHKHITAFGAQLRSLSSFLSRHLLWDEFWEKYPTLTSLRVQSVSWDIVVPPIHHPMRELVLDLQEPHARTSVAATICSFLSAAYQHRHTSSPTLMSASRKVVLAGLKWTEDCKIMKEILIWNVEWEKLAPHVEDELGETLASARVRFLKGAADEEKEPV